MRRVAAARLHTAAEIESYVREALDLASDAANEDVSADTIFAAVLPIIAQSQVLFEQAQAGVPLLDGLRTPGH